MEIPKIKKQYQEEQNGQDETHKISNGNTMKSDINSKINKLFKFGNDEESTISSLEYKRTNKEQSTNHIYNLRFLSIQTFTTPVYIYILHDDPNQEMLKLFNEVGGVVVGSDDRFTTEIDNFIYLEQGLNKCLSLINNYHHNSAKSNLNKPILIFYINFEISSLEVFIILSFLFKISKKDLPIEVIIFTDESIIFALKPGMNTIFIPQNLFTKKGVGLLPMEESIISTKGLLWDVDHWNTKFGDANLSTSNEFEDDECSVYIEKGTIMFSAEIDVNKINFL